MSGNGREDRRVGRTKRRLKAALLELIAERGYDAITISDLTNRADVGRSTFYSHYDSKEDLLFAGFDRWVLTLGIGGDADPRPSPSRYAFSLLLLRHIREQRSFFEATIVRSGDPRLRRRITRLLSERVEGELGDELRPAERTAHARAVVGAFMGLVVWWLEEAPSMAVEDVDRIFRASVA